MWNLHLWSHWHISSSIRVGTETGLDKPGTVSSHSVKLYYTSDRSEVFSSESVSVAMETHRKTFRYFWPLGQGVTRNQVNDRYITQCNIVRYFWPHRHISVPVCPCHNRSRSVTVLLDSVELYDISLTTRTHGMHRDRSKSVSLITQRESLRYLWPLGHRKQVNYFNHTMWNVTISLTAFMSRSVRVTVKTGQC